MRTFGKRYLRKRRKREQRENNSRAKNRKMMLAKRKSVSCGGKTVPFRLIFFHKEHQVSQFSYPIAVLYGTLLMRNNWVM
jgi:hypothetical protein